MASADCYISEATYSLYLQAGILGLNDLPCSVGQTLALDPCATQVGPFEIVWRQRTKDLPQRHVLTERAPAGDGEDLVDESTGYYIVHGDRSVIFLSRPPGTRPPVCALWYADVLIC